MKYLKILSFCAFLLGFTSTFAQCYELVWADEFNYSGAPNPTKWTNEVNGDGGGNNELQYYTDFLRNSRVEDSVLVIEALEESYLGKSYTSARLISYNKASFKYGKMEARIKLPYGQGIWPAFWMLGNNIYTGTGWPSCGEIDILEMVGGGDGRDDTLYGTIHWSDSNGDHAQYGGSRQLSSGIFNDDFHVFSIEWTDTYIRWFLDGLPYHVVDITPSHMSEFHNNFFIILNLAVGGNWPGSPDATTKFPQQMLVDYVRVYQKNSQPSIEGPSEVIKNEADVTFSLVNDTSFLYEWLAPEDAEIVSGQGTSSVKVNWGCSDDTMKCTVTTSCNIHELAFPVAIKETTLSGKSTVHAYEKGLLYQVPQASNTNYTWILPDGARSKKLDSSSVFVNWGASDGTLKVMMENPCGTDTAALEVQAIAQLPYLDEPQQIPGEIRSVYFDTGGEGIAYHDTDEGNNGPGIRPEEDVDTEAGDETGNIGWTYADEWLEYSVEVADSGLYDIQCRTAGLTRGGSFRLLMNGRDITGETMASVASSWTTYRSVYIRNIPLYETDTLLRLEIMNGDFNMANMNFSRVGTAVQNCSFNPEVSIYPTVASSMLHFTNLSESHSYLVINITGNIVKSGIISPDEDLMVNDLTTGLYLLLLQNKKRIITQKFIKTNINTL